MPQSARHVSRTRASQRAFTLLELIISIAVIFLIVTTALVGLRAARKGAERTVSLSALRQMMTGYAAYTTEHKGRVLPGYIDPSKIGTADDQLDIKAKLKNGFRLNAADTASYVWRLAPYVNHEWKTFMADYGSQSLISRFEDEYGLGSGVGGETYGPGTATAGKIGIASHPSFGLNSIFVGGDSFHGPTTVVNGSPWVNLPNSNTASKAVTRISQAKSPTKLIVFAPTRATTQAADLPADVVLGYPELRPPFFDFNVTTGLPLLANRQWFFQGAEGPDQGKAVPDPGTFVGPGGLPVDRLGDARITVAHLDGSTALNELGELGPGTGTDMNTANMTRWHPQAVSSNY